ncbi:MAG: serine/threonine protein kinase, partial [Verrucomicrobiales bacterium]|nr:serine/threonine protein kinase [Verrucomicrobiales bacterium]
MQPSTNCPECGAPLPAFWPKGLCSKCAFEGALDPPAPESLTTPGRDRVEVGSGSSSGVTRFGNYELMEEIGRGGMGIVYRARQVGLNRTVALKMLLGGQFASKQEVLRFRSEAEAAANLQHPNIVGIHETGERDGRHYFSMDFVQGRTLAEIVRGGPLPAQHAARYAHMIAEAIEYAHSQGVLHRDLKPSNVLIDTNDQPRITDFGLAKRVRGDFGLTVSGQVLGSPNFMPPEQCGVAAVVRRRAERVSGAGRSTELPLRESARRLTTAATKARLGPASDVYGIGALLYHLLTGRPPFQAETIEEVLLLLREADPVRPRLLNASVPRDLETICLKCLQKEPDRRYQRAQELADELGRFLRGEPIHARPVSPPEKIWRWACRKPLLAALILLVNVLAAAAVLGIFSQWQRAERSAEAERRERNIALSANRDLKQANLRLAETINLLEFQRAEDFFQARDAAGGVAHLLALLRRDPSNHIAANRLVSALVHRDWALPSPSPMWHSNRVAGASFSPFGTRVLSASWDGTAKVWDAATGQTIATMQHKDAVSCARYNHAGDSIITASADASARIWDAVNGLPLTPPLRHAGPVHSAEFSRDDRLALTASIDQSARIWDVASGTLTHELAGHGSAVRQARFSPDGRLVATGTETGIVRIWSAESGTLLHEINDNFGRVESLAFSPDGALLGAAFADRRVRFWNPAKGDLIRRPFVHSDREPSIWHIAFSPDSRFVLTASEEGAAKVWEVETGRSIGEPLFHESGVNFGEFSPDGRMVITTSTDNTTRLWHARTGLPLCQPLRQIERVVHAGFSQDAERIVTASYDGIVQIWNIASRRSVPIEARHANQVNSVVFEPHGKSLLTASDDNTARLWHPRTGKPLGGPMNHPAPVQHAEFSPDGGRLLTACSDGGARIWDAQSGRMIAGPFEHAKTLWSARFSPDGSQIATASADGTARIWDVRTGRPAGPPLRHEKAVWIARFSPDGRLVATASDDFSARIWDVQSSQPITPPLMHVDHVKWVEFSPNGERLVTASTDRTARLWSVRTGEPVIAPLEHPRAVARATFSPDGRHVATASLDRTARIWDAVTGQALTPPL